MSSPAAATARSSAGLDSQVSTAAARTAPAPINGSAAEEPDSSRPAAPIILRTLRESGLVATRLVGNTRLSRLRKDELEHRFPGLLTSVLAATPPAEQPNPR